jgi:hypothetical protein
MTLKTLPVTHSTPAQSTYRNDSETVCENVVFTFEKAVEYKLPMNFIRRFTRIVHGQTMMTLTLKSDEEDEGFKRIAAYI